LSWLPAASVLLPEQDRWVVVGDDYVSKRAFLSVRELSMRAFVLPVLLLLLDGCVSSQFPGTVPSIEYQATAEAGNMITAEAIAKSNVFTAFQAIERLRPAWLRSRGPKIISTGIPVYATVYIDDHRAGELSQLQSVNARDVAEIRFLSPSEATVTYGTYGGGALGGVISITTQSRRGIPPGDTASGETNL
jgi:hypothetical protein